jgi:hypothetical protein
MFISFLRNDYIKCKGTKKITFKQVKIEKSFTNSRLTCYSGLTVANDYVNHLGLFSELDEVFSTVIKIIAIIKV